MEYHKLGFVFLFQVIFLGIRGTHGMLHHHLSRQIIATSAEVTPKGSLVREFPPKSPKNSGLGIILICPDF